MGEDLLLRAVGEIYDASLEQARLPEIGHALRRVMDVESSITFVCERPSGRMLQLVCASENFTPEARADYARHYHALNVWFQRAVSRPVPYLALGEEIIAPDAFERTEFCADWCRRVGIFHMIGAIEGIREGVVVGSGVQSTRSQGPFDRDEKRRYGIVMAHVGRALQIADRLGLGEATQALSLDILDRLDVGLVLVDASLRPLLVNASAEALVRGADWLVLSQDRIRAGEPAANTRLEALVGAAAATSAGRALSSGGVIRLKGMGGTLPVLVAPFRAPVLELGAMAPVAALVFASAPRREIDAGVLGAALGLTAAEARLLAALASGASLVRYAEEAGISVNTAKTQLAAIFAKTGHAKQSTLVAEVFSNPVLRLRAERRSKK